MVGIPRIRAIYFKQLADRAFQRFLSERNGDFTKLERDGGTLYVYSGTKSRNSLRSMFREWILSDLFSLFPEFDIERPVYNFVLGSCIPRENALLRCVRGNSYFPEVLRKILSSGKDIRYYPVERDIKIDLDLFNSVLEDVFIDLFDRKRAKKFLGTRFRNVFFLRHPVLDCYMVFKVLRFSYGRNSVENVVKTEGMKVDVGLRSLNERIDENVSGKIPFLKSESMAPVRDEVMDFVRGCLEGRV